MKQRIVKLIAKHFYPQNIFANAILQKVSTGGGKKILVDAPCGNGETSARLASNKSLIVFAYDLSENSIEAAKKNFTSENLRFETSNIFDVFSKHDKVDYFCIINSLFLLPHPENVLKNAAGCLTKNGLLFVIIPNIYGRNYSWFKKNHAGINKLELDLKSLPSYFEQQGLHVISVEPLAFAHNFGRKDVKFLSVFAHFYLRALNAVQSLLSIGEPNYYLVVSKKNENN